MIGLGSQFPEELPEKFRALADDVHKITGDLPGERQHDVRVLPQGLGQGHDPGLGGRGLDAPLNLAEVGGFDADHGGKAPHRKFGVCGPFGFSALAKVVSKDAHMCSMCYTLPKSRTLKLKSNTLWVEIDHQKT